MSLTGIVGKDDYGNVCILGDDYEMYYLKMLVSTKGDTSMQEKIISVLNEMSEYLSISQMKKLQEVILRNFAENEPEKKEIQNEEFLKRFLEAKQIEGCSERTIKYYQTTVEHLISQIDTSVRKVSTEEIRE